MKFLPYLLSLTIALPALAQKFDLAIDSAINIEINNHKGRGVQDIGYTKLACINYGIRTTAYLFWLEGNKTYVQRFKDSEYDEVAVVRSQALALVDSAFFLFYDVNRESLTEEEVKSFQHQPGQVTVTSHSCFRNFRLYSGDLIFDRYFDFFDISEFDSEQIDNSKLPKERIEELRLRGWEVDTLYRNSPQRNINYEKNSSLKIVEWDKMISKFIDTVESKGLFVEDR